MLSQSEAPATERGAAAGAGIRVESARRSYPASRGGGDTVTALEGLDLAVASREVVAVVGPSGCGKTTLLELVGGLQDPDAGTVEVAGSERGDDRLAACSYMPQRDLLLPWRDALANAALALECAGMRPAAARARAAPLFERFGLARFEARRPAELSGGMRQRVAFLRALLPQRPILLLDEPFASLDAITRASMQEWLAGALAAEPRTVLAVTHDVEEALFLADRVAVLSPRPGRVLAELEVPQARPRERRATLADPVFVELRRRALEVLGG